eukprot:EG_transcript_17112
MPVVSCDTTPSSPSQRHGKPLDPASPRTPSQLGNARTPEWLGGPEPGHIPDCPRTPSAVFSRFSTMATCGEGEDVEDLSSLDADYCVEAAKELVRPKSLLLARTASQIVRSQNGSPAVLAAADLAAHTPLAPGAPAQPALASPKPPTA